MCKNYLSVTSNAVRSKSGGGARDGGDDFAVRSGGGGAVLLLFTICLVLLQILLPLVNGSRIQRDEKDEKLPQPYPILLLPLPSELRDGVRNVRT